MLSNKEYNKKFNKIMVNNNKKIELFYLFYRFNLLYLCIYYEIESNKIKSIIIIK